MRPGLIIEGNCPWGHGPLQRRDDHGWCVECDAGFSIAPSKETPGRFTVTLHNEFKLASRSGEQPPVLATPGDRDRAGGTNEIHHSSGPPTLNVDTEGVPFIGNLGVSAAEAADGIDQHRHLFEGGG